MLGVILLVLAYMTVVMTAAWAYGLRARNGGWTDVFWTFGTGGALAAAALLSTGEPRGWLVAAIATLWALRLGLYLAPRVARGPEDPRYAAFREHWGEAYRRNMLFVCLPQAPATALLSVSVVLAAAAPGPLGRRDLLGAGVFLLALAGEAVADRQMKAFRADPANKGRVIDTGLWGWSRHPNYFFEWLGWLAYPILAFDPSRPLTWLSLTAPAVMYLLLTRVSGIPPLEESQLKSKGDAYRDYQRRVSAFFPLPPKGRAA